MSLNADDISRLYRCHARAMVAFFARRTLDPEAAVDLVGETFAAGFRDRAKCRARSDEEALAWLYGIARHQLGSFYRRGKVERSAMRRLGVEPRGLTDPEYERVEELAGLAEIRKQVVSLVDQMADDHALVLRLRVVEELEYAQVAEVLGVSEQTARARVSRALRALAARLEPMAVGGVIGHA